NEVLFASVTRSDFEIIGLFDHAAFEHECNGTMTPERTKLWQAYEARQVARVPPGQLMMGRFAGRGVRLASHPIAVVRAAQRHVDIVRQIDPKLDDPDCSKALYPNGEMPSKPK